MFALLMAPISGIQRGQPCIYESRIFSIASGTRYNIDDMTNCLTILSQGNPTTSSLVASMIFSEEPVCIISCLNSMLRMVVMYNGLLCWLGTT